MPRVVHFEFAVEDAERAVKFYTGIFGWKITKWEGPMEYWLVTTGPAGEPGIDGGIYRRQNPGEHTVNTIGVDSVDTYASRIVEAGGAIIQPKTAIPGVGYFANCVDPEGNIFGIMEDDPQAQ